MTAITSAPCWAAAFACSTSSWMLPVATITYFHGAPSNDPTRSDCLSCLRRSTPARSSCTAAGARPRDPEEPRRRALDRDGGVAVDEGLHAEGGAARELARPDHLFRLD